MKRIAFYVYQNKRGVVADYAAYYVRCLLRYVEKVVVIANGQIGGDELRKFTPKDKIEIVLSNYEETNPILAYANGVLSFPFDELKKYDELILTNASVFAPIFPLDNVFEKMEGKNLDFWGITKTKSIDSKKEPYLNSYFTVFSDKVFKKHFFIEYFENLKKQKTKMFKKNPEKHFFEYFKNLGFIEDSFVDNSIFEYGIDDPFSLIPDILIEKYKSPFINKTVFYKKYDILQKENFGSETIKTFNYIKDNTDFGVNLILDDLTKKVSMYEIKKNLHLNFNLSSSYREFFASQKNAIITDSPDLLEPYLKELYGFFDIFCIGDKKTKTKITTLNNNVSYFKQIKELTKVYDFFFMFLPDKNFLETLDEQTKKAYLKHLLDCSILNRIYVSNILDTFLKNPYIGLLTPVPFIFRGFKFFKNRFSDKQIQDLLEKIDFNYEFNPLLLNIVSGAFWLRKEALDSINDVVDFDYDYKVNKGVIFSLLAQKYAFLTASVSNNEAFNLYLDNLEYINFKKTSLFPKFWVKNNG